MNLWTTFLQSEPDLARVATELTGVARFDLITSPVDPQNDIFELKCRLCEQQFLAELVGLALQPNLLKELIADVQSATDGSGRRMVLEHLENTEFVVRSHSTFDFECDCTFRFHQVIGSSQYLWYTDGQFADEADVWLEHRLKPDSIAG